MIAPLHFVRLGYDDQGTGLPVVLLHGFPHDRSLWMQQRRALSPRVRCIVPDLRGFGESASHGPFTMDQYADDVIELLNWLEIDRAVIGGLSMGGYIAMALWRRHPERVRALALCDTKATADNDAGRAARGELIALAKASGAAAVAEKQITGMVGKSTRERRSDVVDGLKAMMSRQSVAGIVGALEALRDRPDSRETIRSISVPTLVVVGSEDALTPISDAQAMMDLLPPDAEARLEIINGAGHASCVERPAAVTQALGEFLASLTVERA